MKLATRILIYVLVFMLVGGVAFVTHAAIIKPYLSKREELASLRSQVGSDNDRLMSMLRTNQRLKNEVHKQSIPADSESKAEYQTALLSILGKLYQASEYSISERPADTRNIPELSKGKFAYQRILFTVTLKKTDVERMTAFMKQFYEMNLLHHISHCQIKREGAIKLGLDERQSNERKDLTATLTIEAIVVDGAPSRKYLAHPPQSAAAVLSGAGLYALEQHVEKNESLARSFRPEKVTEMLAIPAREYSYVAAHDAFHGVLPKWKEPEVVKPPPVITVPKGPDVSPYIRLAYVTRGSDGDYVFAIEDVANNYQYMVFYSVESGKQKVLVSKYTTARTNRTLDDTYNKTNMLVISDPTSSTKHNFKIYGVLENEQNQIASTSLIVGEVQSTSTDDMQALPKGKGNTKSGTTKTGTTTKGSTPFGAKTSTVDPKAALLGNFVLFASKPEKYYRWTTGKTLFEAVNEGEIKQADADKIIRTIGGLPAPVSIPGTVTPKANPFEKALPETPKPMTETPMTVTPKPLNPFEALTPGSKVNPFEALIPTTKLEVAPQPQPVWPESKVIKPEVKAEPVRELAPAPVPLR